MCNGSGQDLVSFVAWVLINQFISRACDLGRLLLLRLLWQSRMALNIKSDPISNNKKYAHPSHQNKTWENMYFRFWHLWKMSDVVYYWITGHFGTIYKMKLFFSDWEVWSQVFLTISGGLSQVFLTSFRWTFRWTFMDWLLEHNVIIHKHKRDYYYWKNIYKWESNLLLKSRENIWGHWGTVKNI